MNRQRDWLRYTAMVAVATPAVALFMYLGDAQREGVRLPNTASTTSTADPIPLQSVLSTEEAAHPPEIRPLADANARSGASRIVTIEDPVLANIARMQVDATGALSIRRPDGSVSVVDAAPSATMSPAGLTERENEERLRDAISSTDPHLAAATEELLVHLEITESGDVPASAFGGNTELFNAMDLNADGRVSFEELIRFVNRAHHASSD